MRLSLDRTTRRSESGLETSRAAGELAADHRANMADKTVGALVNHVVMPGDVIGNVADLEATLEGKGKIKFGPGLREENGVILAYKAGVLRRRNPATYLIDCNQRRVSSKQA